MMPKKASLIIKGTLVIATLYLLAAVIIYNLRTGNNPADVLVYIASGLFGKMAKPSDGSMILLGILLHLLISFIFTWLFSKIYPYLRMWFQNDFTIAIVFGIVVWLLVNLVIVPNSAAIQVPFSWSEALLNCAILIVCVGIPLSFLFSRSYGKA